jgi:hypothetical protein
MRRLTFDFAYTCVLVDHLVVDLPVVYHPGPKRRWRNGIKDRPRDQSPRSYPVQHHPPSPVLFSFFFIFSPDFKIRNICCNDNDVNAPTDQGPYEIAGWLPDL